MHCATILTVSNWNTLLDLDLSEFTSSQRSIAESLLHLRIEDLLQQTNDSTKVPFQRLFFYTQEAPAIILANICTLLQLGQVNGT